MNVRGDFLKTPHSTNTTALICKSRKENPQKPTQLSSRYRLYRFLFCFEGRGLGSESEKEHFN